MANQQHLELLRQGGANTWNTWRQSHPATLPQLHGADLSGADLGNYNLSGADLSEANLQNAHLSASHLIEAVLIGANLANADLAGAKLMTFLRPGQGWGWEWWGARPAQIRAYPGLC